MSFLSDVKFQNVDELVSEDVFDVCAGNPKKGFADFYMNMHRT